MMFRHSNKQPKTTVDEQNEQPEEVSCKVGWSDRLLMIGTAFLYLFLPAALIVLVLVLVAMFVFGLL